ncbi:MAG TPA: hypothetical protein VGM69_14845 [Chloroflexota bacterium]|jgi:hypothetical protein
MTAKTERDRQTTTEIADAAAGVLEARGDESGRRAIEVTLIRPGRSANGLAYAEGVLLASLPLWEGTAAFLDHPDALDLTRAGQRSLRDLVGVYDRVRYEEGIRARLTFYPNAAWAYNLVAAAIADRAAGRPVADIGISADMRVLRRPAADGWAVERITRVVSADLVFQPSAGGAFDRVVEARRQIGGEEMTRPATANGRTSEAAGERAGEARDDAAAISAPETGERRPGAEEAEPRPGAAGQPARGGLDELMLRLEREVDRVEEARQATCQELLGLKLATSGLPEPARATLRREFEGRVFEAGELETRIGALKAMLGEIFGGGVVKHMGAVRTEARVGMSALDRVQAALDRLFDLPLPDALSSVPRLSGIREAYLALTGDTGFTGRPDWESAAVREANEVTTSALANALASSMGKRIAHDFAAQPKWWQPIVVRTSISDFKQQQRIHLNDFGGLSTVAENTAYTNLAWGDRRESYTPAKRGNLVVVTLESIVNDDTHAITRIPRKLAAAGVATLNEFVAGLFTANGGLGPALADGFSVFDAAHHQENAGAAPLSTASVQTALVALLKMSNTAGKRLGLVGKYLLTPPDLFFTARTLLESVNRPGTVDNDVNPIRGALVPISVPNWADPNNWYVLAEPGQIEMIELGFLDGREEPELIVQDQPQNGSVFTNDAISWKVRHVFGGGWLEYRGAYGSVVTG